MIKKVFIFPLSSSMTLGFLPLPYHIFEERYRKMLEASLTYHIPITVLPPTLDPFLGESVFAGIPKLIHSHEDGRSDIVIAGDHRVKVLKVYEQDEYLAADVEELQMPKTFTQLSSSQRDLVRAALEGWMEQQNIDVHHRNIFLNMIQDEHLLLSYGVSLLIKSEKEKISFLKCESWDEWAKLLVKKIGPTEINLGPYLTKLKF